MKLALTFTILLSITLISIGYAALNTNLTISGEATIRTDASIRITNIYIKSSENNASVTYNPTFTDTNTNIGITLPNQNSTITLIIEVTNTTNNYYHLDKITQTINSNTNITYEIKDKDILYFKERSVVNMEITFYYNTPINENTDTTINLDYLFEDIIYEKLEYLTFSGNEFIDTGVLNTGDYIFETDFMQTALTASDGGWVFNGRSHYSYSLGVFSGKAAIFNGYGAATSTGYPKANLNSWYSIYYSRTLFYVNNISYTVYGKKLLPESQARTILIAGATINYNNTPDIRHFIGNIKNFKITDATNNEVLRYFVPAKITEGENTGKFGYWDVINDVFYENAGTGTITGQ